MKNPLLAPFRTPHQSTPFGEIKPEHFIPAIKKDIQESLKAINKITDQKAQPSFDNTINALQNISELLERNSTILFNLNSAETTEEIQQITQQASPLLTKFQNDVRLNQVLFDRVKKVFENRESEILTSEQLTLLKKEFKSFARNGALLSEDEKLILRDIDTEKAKLSLSFGENVLADTNDFLIHITEESQLKGLPDQVKEMGAEIAKSKNYH